MVALSASKHQESLSYMCKSCHTYSVAGCGKIGVKAKLVTDSTLEDRRLPGSCEIRDFLIARTSELIFRTNR